jgi:hypothetical protein
VVHLLSKRHIPLHARQLSLFFLVTISWWLCLSVSWQDWRLCGYGCITWDRYLS